VGGVVAQVVGLTVVFQVLPAVLLATYLSLFLAARRSAGRALAPVRGSEG
jgi:hypothetical protein